MSGAGGVNAGLTTKADFSAALHKQDATDRRKTRDLAHTQPVGGSETMSSPPAAAPTTLSKLASKRKTKKKHFVQQKVEVLRASDPVLSVLMWGVNHSVGVFPPPSPLNTSTRQPTQPHFTQASILLIMRRLTTWARCPCPSCCCQTTSEPAPRSKSTTTSSTSTVTAAPAGGPSLCSLSACTLLISACRPLFREQWFTSAQTMADFVPPQ